MLVRSAPIPWRHLLSRGAEPLELKEMSAPFLGAEGSQGNTQSPLKSRDRFVSHQISPLTLPSLPSSVP